MDINELYTAESHEDGAEMQVRDQSGKLLDMYITIVGIDSKLWRKVSADTSRKMFREEGDQLDIQAEALACASIGWRGFMSGDDEVKFSKAQVKKLYVNAPYIADQVDKFIANRLNFIKGKAD